MGNYIAGGAGAILGGIAGRKSAKTYNKEADKINAKAGTVDLTNTPTPWGDSMNYRDAGAKRALDLLNGSPTAAPPPPATPPPGGRGARPGARPDGPPAKSAGKAGKAGKGGGAAPGTKEAPFKGQSTQTAAAIDAAMRLAGEQEKGPVATAAQGYTADTLNGVDRNGYRVEAADMLRDLDDADLKRYKEMLFGSDLGLSPSTPAARAAAGRENRIAARAAAGYTASAVGAPGSGNMQDGGIGWANWGGEGAEGAGPVGIVDDLQGILAGDDVPGVQAMRDRIRRNADEAFNEQLRQRRLEAAGSGMYGGTGQLSDEQYALGRYGSGLADAYAQQDYDTYRQALGQAQQYDLTSMDRVSRERMGAADRAAQERAAAHAASSAGAANAAAIASQERMQRLGLLSGAIGMGMDQSQFRTSGFGSLAGDFSADQRAASAGATDTANIGMSGYMNAGGLSLGSDQARNAWQGSQNSLKAAQTAANTQRSIANQQLQFDQYRYNREAPWQDLHNYQQAIGGFYDPFTGSQTKGTDFRGLDPMMKVDPTAEMMWGAAAGYNMAQGSYSGGYGQMGGGGFGGGINSGGNSMMPAGGGLQGAGIGGGSWGW